MPRRDNKIASNTLAVPVIFNGGTIGSSLSARYDSPVLSKLSRPIVLDYISGMIYDSPVLSKLSRPSCDASSSAGWPQLAQYLSLALSL